MRERTLPCLRAALLLYGIFRRDVVAAVVFRRRRWFLLITRMYSWMDLVVVTTRSYPSLQHRISCCPVPYGFLTANHVLTSAATIVSIHCVPLQNGYGSTRSQFFYFRGWLLFVYTLGFTAWLFFVRRGGGHILVPARMYQASAATLGLTLPLCSWCSVLSWAYYPDAVWGSAGRRSLPCFPVEAFLGCASGPD